MPPCSVRPRVAIYSHHHVAAAVRDGYCHFCCRRAFCFSEEPMTEQEMKKKILIVEDNVDLLGILEKSIEVLGYDSVVTTSGQQAVDLAARQPDNRSAAASDCAQCS